ncbi:MAG: TSUP family transporter [Hydrogenophaga sp.]|uniref:TSUP family transporter n=1 Tax=Hydrogenophaga sp. TaxID=1904254 RepID=UPI001D9A43CB|nr:TSUP family transporter [Hydrogenophaga sp.]MBX3609063.1 TSUP family transporter [Hydrogenophaga sp.]
MELLLASAASLLAGFIDAIVGGGGLVLVPAMFAIFPNTHPATLFGINKGAAVWGTGAAAVQFARRVDMPWASLLPAAALTFGGAMLGAWTVTVVSPDYLRRVLPLVLGAVLAYTLMRKELGREHMPTMAGLRQTLVACCMGVTIGFYDGFFGPGTGSFFVFLFVRWLGFDFLHASASAKLLNTASNLAALLLFAIKGHVWWHYALVMAVANVVGSVVGTRLALKHGSGFVRAVFIAVVSVLIAKTAYDAWFTP